MVRIGWVVLVFFLFGNIHSQEKRGNSIKHQIEIGHDNDFFVLTDRYYSSGLFLNYRRVLNKGIFPDLPEQFEIGLGQEVFTPNNIETRLLAEIDRLYTGYTRLAVGWSVVKNRNFLELAVQTGIAGQNSGAGGFQRWYHDAIVRWPTPTWFAEIEQQYHLNFDLSYAVEWRLAPVPFGVHLALEAEAAVGSRDIYFQPDVLTYFGRRNRMGESIAYNRIGSMQREIYFALGTGYRWVEKNAFLEASASDETGSVSPQLKTGVWHLIFDFRHRSGQNDYRVGYRFLSKEALSVTDHQYLIFRYGRSF